MIRNDVIWLTWETERSTAKFAGQKGILRGGERSVTTRNFGPPIVLESVQKVDHGGV